MSKRLNKLFAGYYHADCTANHKYVPERCLFYIYRYHGPQYALKAWQCIRSLSDQPHSLSQDMGTTFFITSGRSLY